MKLSHNDFSKLSRTPVIGHLCLVPTASRALGASESCSVLIGECTHSGREGTLSLQGSPGVESNFSMTKNKFLRFPVTSHAIDWPMELKLLIQLG